MTATNGRDLERLRKLAWNKAITKDLKDRRATLNRLSEIKVVAQLEKRAKWVKAHREAFLDRVKPIAWYHAILEATGWDHARLSKETFKDDSENQEIVRWNLYRDGEVVPRLATLKRVEKHSSGVAQGTERVFTRGPDGHPLWAVLGYGSAKRAWREALDDWFFPAIPSDSRKKPPAASDHAVARAAPFAAKVDAAWNRLVPADATINFAAYARDEEPNAVTVRIHGIVTGNQELLRKRAAAETLLTAADRARLDALPAQLGKELNLTTVIGTLALWRFAESTGEKLNEARYLARGVLPLLPFLLKPWGIGEAVDEHLNMLVPFPVASREEVLLYDIINRGE